MPEAIRVTRGGTHVPLWGNDGRSDKDKIAVHYRFLSFEEQQALLNPKDIGESFAYQSRVLARMIGKVENLSVVDEDGERKIETGDQLVSEPGLDELAYELWLELRSKQAVDKKKLK